MLQKDMLSEIKKHFTKIYTKRGIIKKVIAFLIIGILVLVNAFLIRDSVLKQGERQFDIMGNFLTGKVEFNPGLSFSMFKNNPALVYSLQAVLVVFVFVYFFLNPFYFLDYGICLIGFGGTANLIDRGVIDIFNGVEWKDTVVDYLQFKFISSAIFNYQDVMIVIGWILTTILIIYMIVRKNFFKKN